jgi:hypothetical protein
MVLDIAGHTLDSATSLNLSGTNQLFTDSLTPLYNTDYWKFQLSSASNFNLTVNGLSQDVNVELLDTSGAVIKGSYNTGSLAETINQNLNPGNYYLGVRLNNNTTSTAYNLNLSAPVNPLVNITATDATAGETLTTETADLGKFTLTRTGDITSALTVNYTVDGTAINFTDYNTLNGSATFAAGTATTIIDITPVDDSEFEGIETVGVSLISSANYNLGTNNFATLNIADNDKPTITVSTKDVTAGETLSTQTANPGQFSISRGGNTALPLTVNYTVAGTGINGTDYIKLNGTATFAGGSATTIINVLPIDDTISEANETVVLTLAAGTTYNLGTAKTATVNIADNDIPVITIAATDTSAGETLTTQTANPGRFTLTRIGNLASALTVNYTVAGTGINGTDYTSLPGSVTFAAGAATTFVDITPIDDSQFEGSETVVVNLATGSNYNIGTVNSATVTIAENDKPTVTVIANDNTAGETLTTATANPGQFTLSRSGNTLAPLTVNYTLTGTATNGTDYSNLTGSVTFAAGYATTTINVTPIDDTVSEGNESVVLTLVTGTNYNLGTGNTATVTIVDNDLPTITINANDGNAGETLTGQIANPGQFTLTRIGSTASSLTVNYTVSGTAINGTDYNTLTNSVTFAAGSSTALININPINDAAFEGNETVIVSLATATNYILGTAKSGTVTIADNDKPTITISATDINGGETLTGQTANPGQFIISRSGITTQSLTVNYAVQGTATNGTDYDAVSGSVVIPVGQSSVTVPINVKDDLITEGDETVVFNLQANSSYVLGNNQLAIVRIADSNLGNNLKLDGVDDYISVTLDEPETEITHEFRFKTSDPNAGLFAVVNSDLGADGHDRHIYLTGGNVKARVWNNQEIQSTGLNLADGNWHHVAYVMGASVGGQKLYIDGQLVASGNKTASDFNWQKRINIGFSNDAVNKYLNGNIDEVRIWNKTRTQSEIQSYMDHELVGNETGLIGYYKLNESTGTVAVDSSIGQRNGTLVNNPTRVNPNLGLPTNPNQWNVSFINRNDTNYASVNEYDFNHPDATTTIEKFSLNGNLQLDGVDDYVNLPAMTFGGAVTVEAWVYVDQHQFWQRIIDFGNGAANNNIILGFSSNTGNMFWETFQGGTGQKLITNDVFPTNQWVHVTAVNDGQGNGYIYWNGELKASGNLLAPLNVTRNNNYIGRSNWSADAYFKGKMDDVRVWNTARTQTDIKNSLNKELTGNEAGLIGYWKLNEGAGNIAVDSTITKRNGSLINNPTWNQGGLVSLRVDFGGNSPAPNIQADKFAMQAWTTTKLDAGKTYQVTTQSDDGTRFFIKNLATGEITYIGADWRIRGAGEPSSTTFFKVNQTGNYDFFVQYFEHLGGSNLNIELKETPANGLPNHTGLINDISKDGKHDILWRDYSSGAGHFWSMDGGNLLTGVDIPDYLDMAWHPVAMADFNNDGNMDIVWRYHWIDNTGWDRIWLMNGNTRLAEVEIDRVADNNWHIVGTGDFNLDGSADILWRNYATGQNHIWQMNGTTRTTSIILDPVTDLNQRIVGTGDFNGDGKSDILWRNANTGQLYIWFMDGLTKSSVQNLSSSPDLIWSVGGTGDMNNDGKSDIIWRNLNTGNNTVWLMNGATKTGDLDIHDVPERNWNIVGDSDQIPIWTADYFGNKDLTGSPTYTEGFINITGNFSRDWGTGSPPNTPVDNFSARYKTQQYLAPGLYKVNLGSDDGIRVWIGNELIINQWTDQVVITSDYFTSSGGYYPVTIEYKENGGNAWLNYEIVKYQPYDTFGDGVGLINSWSATFFHWNGQGTPIMDDAHKIGTVKLTGNTRGDGQWGMDLQNWGAGSPAPGVPVDNFAMHAYTRAGLTAGRTYEVWVRSDDGYQVFAHKLGGGAFNITPNALNGEWQPGAYGNAVKWTFVAPESGTFDFKINMFEGGGDAYVDLVLKDVTVVTPPPPVWENPLVPGSYVVTQEYSGPTFYSNHTGIDLGSKGSVIGGRVEAVRNGTVIRAGWDTTGYGNLVVVDHGDGLKSYYSHLNSISVGVGQQVNINTQVGTLGTTGNSTGPHLHLEVRLNNVPQNPRNYISGL